MPRAPSRPDPSQPLAALDVGLEAGASDWHFRGGEPGYLRIEGRLVPLDEPPRDESRLQAIAMAALGSSRQVCPDADASFEYRGEIFRLHAYCAGGVFCFNLRHIPGTIPALETLGIPHAFRDAALESPRGLILVTGPAGAGKSTTLAASLDHINRSRAELILTFEDPIEFRHRNRLGVIRQLEKGRDFASFADALRGALRCDPDVLFVGEMRDLESMSAALTAAETGHLVLGTLHGAVAKDAVSRIVDAVPPERAQEVRVQLSKNLVAVLAQQRVRAVDGRLVCAFELLLATPAVRHLIGDPGNKCVLLSNEIAMGHGHGMVSMDRSLEDLWRSGIVDRAEALRSAANPSALEALLRR